MIADFQRPYIGLRPGGEISDNQILTETHEKKGIGVYREDENTPEYFLDYGNRDILPAFNEPVTGCLIPVIC